MELPIITFFNLFKRRVHGFFRYIPSRSSNDRTMFKPLDLLTSWFMSFHILLILCSNMLSGRHHYPIHVNKWIDLALLTFYYNKFYLLITRVYLLHLTPQKKNNIKTKTEQQIFTKFFLFVCRRQYNKYNEKKNTTKWTCKKQS